MNQLFWLSKETSILVNNWFMMYFLTVVLIGTVYPIFLEVISSEKISVNDLIIKCVATALKKHPEININWTDYYIYIYWEQI